MASIEFIKKRIAGKIAEIEKLEKKLKRINKAKESNWENNPYYYDESDLRRAYKDLDAANAALEKYEHDMEVEQDKVNTRARVPSVIIQFLEDWKKACRDYYEECLPKFIEARDEWYRVDHEYCNWFNSRARVECTNEEYKVRRDANRRAEEKFKSSWNFITPYIIGYKDNTSLDWDKINKDLDREADLKCDFIIERVTDIAGQITDASDLTIGHTGELNGYIIGTKGVAKVQTVGAGGYNIQRFHFRTLIHKMK